MTGPSATDRRQGRQRRGKRQGGNAHGRTGGADGRRHDREEFFTRSRGAWEQARDSREEIRHLAADELARMAANLKGDRLRPARDRVQARRRCFHHRQRSTRMGLCRHGHPVRRRCFLRHLSDRCGGPDRISPEGFRDACDLRRGRRATRQDPRLPRALRELAKDRRVRHGGPERLLRRHGDVARRVSRARPQLYGRPRGAVAGDDRQPQRRRSCRSRLHLRHHRPAQGRDARQSQRDAPDAARQRLHPGAGGRGPSDLPATLSRRRTRRRLLHLGRARLGDELCREPGDGAGQSARGAADGLPCGAAHLGKILFVHHHRAEGCDAIAAMGLPACDLRRLSHGRLPDRGRTRRRFHFAWPTISPTGSHFATSAA